jgi:hypothetical protein
MAYTKEKRTDNVSLTVLKIKVPVTLDSKLFWKDQRLHKVYQIIFGSQVLPLNFKRTYSHTEKDQSRWRGIRNSVV